MINDIKLSTGRTIKHRPMDNGAQDAYATPGPEEMTHAELTEYRATLLLMSFFKDFSEERN